MLGIGLATGAVKQYLKADKVANKREYIFNEENAEKIAKTLCKMRGAPLKLGQALRYCFILIYYNISGFFFSPPVFRMTI